MHLRKNQCRDATWRVNGTIHDSSSPRAPRQLCDAYENKRQRTAAPPSDKPRAGEADPWAVTKFTARFTVMLQLRAKQSKFSVLEWPKHFLNCLTKSIYTI